MYERVRKHHFSASSQLIITFDKGDRVSFDTTSELITEVSAAIPRGKIPMAVVGFLTSSEAITAEEARELATKFGLSYYETKPSDPALAHTLLHRLAEQLFGD